MNKNFVFLFLMVLNLQYVKGQNASVEKNIFNVQTGILGIWASNENKLGNDFALRTEIGLDLGYYISYNLENKYVLAPIVLVEPRWYYNLESRLNKGKHIKNNSGNFLGLKVKYIPDWFVISDFDNYSVANQVSIIPRWGIRRAIGKSNFNYEIATGLGYKYVFLKNTDNDLRLVLDVHLRIGYTFN